MKSHRFIRSGLEWYIDLPQFLEQGGNISDLQMVDGADKMLDMMAWNETEITLIISKEYFEGAETLTLTEKCEPTIGGGYYFMKEYDGHEINQTMWLCQVTEFVLGEIPKQIFVKKEHLRVQQT